MSVFISSALRPLARPASNTAYACQNVTIVANMLSIMLLMIGCRFIESYDNNRNLAVVKSCCWFVRAGRQGGCANCPTQQPLYDNHDSRQSIIHRMLVRGRRSIAQGSSEYNNHDKTKYDFAHCFLLFILVIVTALFMGAGAGPQVHCAGSFGVQHQILLSSLVLLLSIQVLLFLLFVSICFIDGWFGVWPQVDCAGFFGVQHHAGDRPGG